MREWSIRQRLTLWYTLALAAGLCVFALATWLSMWHSLTSELEARLAQRLNSVERFINQEIMEPNVQLREELEEYAQAFPSGTYLQVSDERGSVIFATKPQAGRSYRQLARTILVNGRRWQIVTSESLDQIDNMLAKLRVLLVSLSPLIAILATAGSLWLSRRAMKPVNEMTAAVGTIGISNLAERVRVPQTGDELQKLAETWNKMLGRLEGAVRRLSRFTADASHELRTPLAVIRTTAEIASRRPRSDTEYREALAAIVTESERMTRLVEDLLFLARCDSEIIEMPMTAIELAPIVEDLCAEVRPLAESKSIRVSCKVRRQDTSVVANEPAIRRLLLALLDNAIKYSAKGGEVHLGVHKHEDQVLVEIRDAGLGIPQSELPRIFERFYRAPGARDVVQSGSGLGLSLAASIAQQHRARIEVESALGQGSTFRVLFQQAA